MQDSIARLASLAVSVIDPVSSESMLTGASVPPLLTVTAPDTYPVPPSVPPLLTVTTPVPVALVPAVGLFASNVPPLIVVPLL